MLPALIFVVACFLAFASGTSWGTFGILIPIVTGVFTDPATGAVLPGADHLLVIGVAACLAGAVMGDHCSPISDTTIMASAGASVTISTMFPPQVPYVLTVAGISFCQLCDSRICAECDYLPCHWHCADHSNPICLKKALWG